MTEVAAPTTTSTEIYDTGRANESTDTDFLERSGMEHTESSRISDDVLGKKTHKALHHQRDIHQKQMQQQQRDSKSNLRAEASFTYLSFLRSRTEFRTEYDASAEKDEFHEIQLEQLGFQAEEKMEHKRSLNTQEAGEELRRREASRGMLVNFFEGQLRNQRLEYS